MLKSIARLIVDRSGVAAIEYGLIAGLISVAIIGAVSLIGDKLNAKFMAIANALN